MKKLIATVILAALFSGCATVQPKKAGPISWDELHGLLGHDYKSDIVMQFVKANGLNEYSKGNSGSYSSPAQAFSFVFTHGRMERLVMIVSRQGEAKGPIYTGQLPRGLVASDTPEDVIAKLGKPPRHTFREFMHYDKIGLTVSYYVNTDQMAQVDVNFRNEL